jgi:hypothetical protein
VAIAAVIGSTSTPTRSVNPASRSRTRPRIVGEQAAQLLPHVGHLPDGGGDARVEHGRQCAPPGPTREDRLLVGTGRPALFFQTPQQLDGGDVRFGLGAHAGGRQITLAAGSERGRPQGNG